MGRVILDTGVLAAIDRRKLTWADVLSPDDDAVIAAVTAAELLEGCELGEEKHRARRRTFVQAVLANIPVEPYDLTVARMHAQLLAHCRRKGTPRRAHDLIIAATAAGALRTLLTMDAKAEFGDLPGVTARVLPRR